jgi:hypothetical protein
MMNIKRVPRTAIPLVFASLVARGDTSGYSPESICGDL